MELNKILVGDCLSVLESIPDGSMDCVVTSPPYWQLRDYGVDGQLGLEPTFQEYIEKLLEIFDEVKRVLKDTGTCFVVLGDTYSASGTKGNYTDPKREKYVGNGLMTCGRESVDFPKKCLLQIPSRFAIGMTDHGWVLRNEIIWSKMNPLPESVADRFTSSHEKAFFFVKSEKYYFDQQAVMETAVWQPGEREDKTQKDFGGKFSDPDNHFGNSFRAIREKRNKRDVWQITAEPSTLKHFAMFPQKLIEPMILAGCPENGIVLDPFIGSGTTGIVAIKNQRNIVGIELNPEYAKLAQKRIDEEKAQITMFEILNEEVNPNGTETPRADSIRGA